MAKSSDRSDEKNRRPEAKGYSALFDVGNAIQAEHILKSKYERLAKSLPTSVDVDRYINIAVELVRTDENLLKCTQQSFYESVERTAQLGLELDPALGQAYLIPYGRACQRQIGYKGWLKLLLNTGQIKSVDCRLVHQKDDFDYAYGDEPFVSHRPKAFKPEEICDEAIIFGYLIVRMENGGKHINVWPVEKGRYHRDKFSKAYDYAENGTYGKKDSVWHHHFGKMFLKSIVLEEITSGRLPLSVDIVRAAQEDKMVDAKRPSETANPEKPQPVRSMDDLANQLDKTKGKKEATTEAAKPAAEGKSTVVDQPALMSNEQEIRRWFSVSDKPVEVCNDNGSVIANTLEEALAALNGEALAK